MWRIASSDCSPPPISGICVTVWSQATEWPSWASTPSRRWLRQRPKEKRKVLVWAFAHPTCESLASRWTQKGQVNTRIGVVYTNLACGRRIIAPSWCFFFSSRSWCYWISVSTGRGGTESTGCYSWRLRLSGALPSSLHLWQWRSEKGHHLSVVWRFKEEVRMSAVLIFSLNVLYCVFTVTLLNPVLFRLPDGLTRRGDINLLMLGDPGTAKSQLLKFVERCSPIGVGINSPVRMELDYTVPDFFNFIYLNRTSQIVLLAWKFSLRCVPSGLYLW